MKDEQILDLLKTKYGPQWRPIARLFVSSELYPVHFSKKMIDRLDEPGFFEEFLEE